MFTIIGERINMIRKKIKEKVWKRDTDFIILEAKKQAEAGATHIDVNAGGDPAKEVDDMKWLTKVVSRVTSLPLVFDSTNPVALEERLKLCNQEGTIINSITAEKNALKKFCL